MKKTAFASQKNSFYLMEKLFSQPGISNKWKKLLSLARKTVSTWSNEVFPYKLAST